MLLLIGLLQPDFYSLLKSRNPVSLLVSLVLVSYGRIWQGLVLKPEVFQVVDHDFNGVFYNFDATLAFGSLATLNELFEAPIGLTILAHAGISLRVHLTESTGLCTRADAPFPLQRLL